MVSSHATCLVTVSFSWTLRHGLAHSFVILLCLWGCMCLVLVIQLRASPVCDGTHQSCTMTDSKAAHHRSGFDYSKWVRVLAYRSCLSFRCISSFFSWLASIMYVCCILLVVGLVFIEASMFCSSLCRPTRAAPPRRSTAESTCLSSLAEWSRGCGLSARCSLMPPHSRSSTKG